MLRFFAFLFVAMSGVQVASANPATSNEPVVLTHQLPKWAQGWSLVSDERRVAIADDDIRRHDKEAGFWDGISMAERRFSENGFDWHLLRFSSTKNPYGIIWVVPHDDENAAFEAMIDAVKKHGGMGIVVNSGPGSLRRQAGRGTCGGRPAKVTSCDPNRNYSDATPLFTSAFLDHRTESSQPIIALHTNGPGAAGDFSLLDIDAYKKGRVELRAGAYRADKPKKSMANYDTLGLIAYPSRNGGPSGVDVACRSYLNKAGIHFWHEEVGESDGSLSNYLALQYPEIPYFNAESRSESDLAVSAARHLVMINAYLEGCKRPSVKATP